MTRLAARGVAMIQQEMLADPTFTSAGL